MKKKSIKNFKKCRKIDSCVRTNFLPKKCMAEKLKAKIREKKGRKIKIFLILEKRRKNKLKIVEIN